MATVETLEIFTDGACSGNPGEAGIGIVLRQGGKRVWELSLGIGSATNNIAEYLAVIYGLQQALILKAREVVVHTDSELLARQCQGRYKVKDVEIRRLFNQVAHLRTGFRQCRFEHIPREQNKDADALARQSIYGKTSSNVCRSTTGIKKEQAKVVALELNFGEESPSSKG